MNLFAYQCSHIFHAGGRTLRLKDYALKASAPALLMVSGGCSSTGSSAGADSFASDSVREQGRPMETVAEEQYKADYDIGMTISSVADAINVGEPLDSVEYNFDGVLTDAMGAPLFTDFSGFPGQWEVTVVNSRELRIRNKGTGDLSPEMLVDYLKTSLAERNEGEIEKVDEYDEGDARISEYTYGRTALRIETRPELLPTGEVGPRLEITLRSDTLARRQPVEIVDSLED